jgi:hypothetical protein
MPPGNRRTTPVLSVRIRSWTAVYLPGGSLRIWLVSVIAFSLGFLPKPASAQETATEHWDFQGGPYAGVLINRPALPEFGFRFGARRGAQTFDLNLSAIRVITQEKAYLPAEREWRGYGASAGLGWQPGLLGIGIRAGLFSGLTVLSDRYTRFVLTPHAVLAIPLNLSLDLRGEAGVGFIPSTGRNLPGLYGTARLGFEWRLQ